jgi:hypothetical protein
MHNNGRNENSKIKTIALYCGYFSLCLVLSHIYPSQKIRILHTMKAKNSFITYLLIDGKEYLIKQKKNENNIVLSIVKDALAAWVGNSLNISHAVKIISASDNTLGKVKPNAPAVLLTKAPGVVIKDLPKNHKFANLAIRQRKSISRTIKEEGLTKTVINQMILHPQLPIIVALDLFIGNAGRHNNNFFYDSQSNSFCVIDMDHAFRGEVAALAYRNLTAMVVRKISLSHKEISSLTIVSQVLKKLLKNYSAHEIKKQLRNFVKQTGLSLGDSHYSSTIENRLRKTELDIDRNELLLYKIVALLEKIIDEK